MGNKDMSMKSYLRNNERFADVVNGMLFDGEYKVLPESLVDINTELIEKIDDSDTPIMKDKEILLKQVFLKVMGNKSIAYLV